ncbi:MAG: hypothetical protein IJJ07_04060, partial [Lachnospiraceae bacterium]|nr:hypothetical protein [Lachnospiraceae bacterium]
DVIIPLVDEEEDSLRLLSSKVFRWSLIYNGKKGIDGAWKSLVNINAATLDRIKVTDCRQKVNLVRPGYRAVVNWI